MRRMQRKSWPVGVVLAVVLAPLWGGARQDTDPEATTPPQEAAAPPRVVGQTATPEEAAAWQQVQAAPDPATGAKLAQDFLAKYPESGMTPHAHYVIAQYAYQLGDFDTFQQHAEEAVRELPFAVDLLSQLAFLYSEKGDPAKAISRATQALEGLGSLRRPPEIAPENWVAQLYQVRAESNYALGRAFLSRVRGGKPAEDPNMRQAVNYLRTALQNDPQHDYAAFRLGFALRNLGDVEGTLRAYGRAVAIGGVAAEPARGQIQEILNIVKNAMPDSPWAKKTVEEVVAEAQTELIQEVARVEAEKTAEINRIRMQEVSDSPGSSDPVDTAPGGLIPPGS